MRLATLLMSCAMPAMAQDFSLELPVDCTLDDTCYIQNYVDRDPTEGASDFQCGPLTYDGHKGTDFGLISLADMTAGVAVLAAADGTVRGTRNDMRDVIYTPNLAGEINGRDCGNGMVIAHGGGWETQYCHLREGSVTVLSGDTVKAGDVLGLIGLSGRTQFPHLHLSVRRDGIVIDPFSPDVTTGSAPNCASPANSTLWDETLSTPQGGLIAAAFANSIPDYADVKAGTAATNELAETDPIVVWGFLFGVQAGDIVSISFTGPDGPLFETDDVLDRTQALAFRAGGLNAPDSGWPAGEYTGSVTHSRDGTVLDNQLTTATLR